MSRQRAARREIISAFMKHLLFRLPLLHLCYVQKYQHFYLYSDIPSVAYQQKNRNRE